MTHDYKDLFKNIIDNLTLEESDLINLTKDRGLPIELVQEMQFRSSSPSQLDKPCFKDIPETFKSALSYKNIVIPYFNSEKEIVHIRPHKFGIENISLQVYIPWKFMEENPEVLVVAESEFKALASCVMGVPAIGIPGIASFSKSNYDKFAKIMQGLRPKKIVICFDNEIKDNPKLANFKPDYTKRYDTMFYAYVMAWKLNIITKINTKIAVLNPEWMKDGKVDIDSFLGSGKDHKLYKEVIDNAITMDAYKNSWKLPNTHVSFLERKLDRFFYSGPVVEKYDSYYWKESNKNEYSISNFVIKVIHTYYTAEGKAQRLCKFFSKYGDSKPIVIDSEMMVSRQAFQKFAMDMGDYDFSGSDAQLKAIWKYIFMNQDGRGINLLNHFGYSEVTEAWFFKNGGYYKNEYYPANENNIIWINDHGYMVECILDDLDPPTFSLEQNEDVNLVNILKNLTDILDNDHARLIIGWALGNFFMPEITNEWGIYPFLFLHGKAQAGKSTIANWISSFFGFTQKGINFHSSSPVGISRTTDQMSMIPVWLEEYRNKDPDIGKKNNFLRSIYDRSVIVKGTKKENQIKTYKARSTLIISGEEHPRDAALNSRCIMFSIFRNDEKQKQSPAYAWLEKNKSYFNYIGHHILTHKKELWAKIKPRILDYIHSFDTQGINISSRNKIQMSIVSGVADVMVGEDKNFSLFVAAKSELMENRVRDDQALYVFFDDVYNMWATGRFKIDIFKVSKKVNSVTESYFLFSVAYSEWETHFKSLRNDIPSSKNTLTDQIKREPYYIGRRQARVGKISTSVIVFDFNHPKLPTSLKMLAGELDEKGGEDDEGGDSFKFESAGS